MDRQGRGVAAGAQSQAVGDKLREFNPDFDGKVVFKAEGEYLTDFAFSGNGVDNIGPVAALKQLHKLVFSGTPPMSGTDKARQGLLAPLKGLQLTELRMAWSQVKDLSPLKDAPLRILDCSDCPVESLDVLEGKRMIAVNCAQTGVSTLAPLKGAPLVWLSCAGTKVADLTPIQGTKITELYAQDTLVADIAR